MVTRCCLSACVVARKAAKGSALLSKQAGMEIGMARGVMGSLPRQARQGLWITLDAEIAKPSGWLGALGVWNLDSFASLAETPILRMAEEMTHCPETPSNAPFAALRATRFCRMSDKSHD